MICEVFQVFSAGQIFCSFFLWVTVIIGRKTSPAKAVQAGFVAVLSRLSTLLVMSVYFAQQTESSFNVLAQLLSASMK